MSRDEIGLTLAEVELELGEILPNRQQLSRVNANLALPINAAVAASVLSVGATAAANAVQGTPIDQSNL